MKTKASTFLNQMISTIVEVIKAKSTAVHAKTSAMKTRFLIFGILRNKKLLMSAINHKIHAIMGQDSKNDHSDHGSASSNGDDDNAAANKKAVVLYTTSSFVTECGAEALEAGA